jgi:outer membrane protein TolC
VAEAMLARERLMEDVAAAEVRLQTAQAYVEAWYAAEAVTLGQHNEAHAREELEAGKGRLLAAAGASAEVLMLAGAQGLAADETAELRQQQAAAEAGLQRWLRSRPEGLLAPQLPEPPAEAVYVERHPEVLARERELALARQEAEVARLNTQPNWTYEVAYGQRQGRPDLVSVGISIPLPIAPAARQDRETAARLALVDKAEAALDEARRAAAGDYARLASDAARLQQRLERLQAALLTPARQRTEAALAAYRANQAALSAVFEARHAELEAERRRLGLARELARTQVQLIYKPVTEGPTP